MRFRFFLISLIGYVLLTGLSIADDSADDPVILVIGDSLSAGYGMSMVEAWPTLLQKRLLDNGHQYRVQNASITGDTTQGGITRLPRLLERYQPEWVIIELGGNDGLRGLQLNVTQQNLEKMAHLSLESGARVILTGIMLPPNYGPTYTARFSAIYTDLAKELDLLLVPFFMDGVALVEGMMQADGIHPSVKAQPILLDNVWEVMEPALP